MPTTRMLNYFKFTAPHEVKFFEEPLAELRPGQVRVRTTRSLISPGSETALYEGTHSDILAGRRKYPTSGAYSAVGVVEAAGPEAAACTPGDRVAVAAGHSNYSIVAVDNALPIPAGVADDDAVFFHLGAIVLHGLREAAPQFGENVLVMGLGAIGQVAVRLLRLAPAAKIIGADLFPLRLDAARQGGATAALDVRDKIFADTVRELTGGRGCEIVIEASGNPKAVLQALDLLAPHGRLVILGCPHGEAPLDLYTSLQKKELSIVGSYQPMCPDSETPYTPWTKKRNQNLILEYLRAQRVEFASLITHRARYADALHLYETLSRKKDLALGGIFDWD